VTVAGPQLIPLGARNMTRFCIQCNQIIGEKCVRCGTEATANSNGHAVTGAEFDCPSCCHHFQQGDGGETGGMCEPCFDAELQSAHEQAARNPATTKVWARNHRRTGGQCKTLSSFSQLKENLVR
jgi:transposase-like protein